MNNHNKLFSSGQTITLATGEDYIIKSDEVFINDHPYKKNDLEIALSNVLLEAPLTDPEKIHIAVYTKRTKTTKEAAILLPFTKWEIDSVIAGTLAESVELINTAIGVLTSSQLLSDALQEHDQTQIILNQIKETPYPTELQICISKTSNIIEITDTQSFDFNQLNFIIDNFGANNVQFNRGKFYPDTNGSLNMVFTTPISYNRINGAVDFKPFAEALILAVDTDSDLQLSSINNWYRDANDPNVIHMHSNTGETIDIDSRNGINFTSSSVQGDVGITINNGAVQVIEESNDSQQGSLVKEFNELGEEILANRKFYKSGVLISEPIEWVEGNCPSELDLSNLKPTDGDVSLFDQSIIDGRIVDLIKSSAVSFEWDAVLASGSFTLTNKVTNIVSTYTFDSGVLPSNSVDYGRFYLEDMTIDATNAVGLYLSVQGCRIKDI